MNYFVNSSFQFGFEVQKCLKHPNIYNPFLHLDETANMKWICSQCKQKYAIHDERVISIDQFIHFNEGRFFLASPVNEGEHIASQQKFQPADEIPDELKLIFLQISREIINSIKIILNIQEENIQDFFQLMKSSPNIYQRADKEKIPSISPTFPSSISYEEFHNVVIIRIPESKLKNLIDQGIIYEIQSACSIESATQIDNIKNRVLDQINEIQFFASIQKWDHNQKIKKDRDALLNASKQSSLVKVSSLSLNIANVSIGPDEIQFISAGLGYLASQLSSIELYLGNHKIEQIGVQCLSLQLIHIQNLKSLSLNFDTRHITYGIGSIGVENISHALSQMEQLSYLSLSLSENKIASNGSLALSSMIARLTQLTSLKLNLSQNLLKIEEITSLSQGLAKLNKLRHLELILSKNMIETEGISCIAIVLLQHKQQLTSLSLNLKENRIEVEGVQYLSSVLIELKQLETLELNLNNNRIGSNGFESLSKGLSQLPKLTILSLSLKSAKFNKINQKGFNLFSQKLTHLKLLTSLTLNFSCNGFTQLGAKMICTAITQLSELRYLSFNFKDNRLETSEKFFEELSKVQQISALELNLISNNMYSLAISQLSNSLLFLKNLKCLKLYLDDNNISDEGVNSLISYLKKANNLFSITIDLKGNFFNSDLKLQIMDQENRINSQLPEIPDLS